MAWQPIHLVPPPKNAWPLAVVVTFKCKCMPGAKAAFAASIEGGVWRIDCNHDIEVTHWMRLPQIPGAPKDVETP